jgi:hypothetical protein
MADFDADVAELEAPEADTGPSLRDDLAATFKQMNEAEAPVIERDEAGRFAAKSDTPVVETPPPEAETPVETATEEAAPVAEAPVTEAPSSWRGEAKAKWAELPAEVRSEVERRETEVRQMAGRMDTERQAGRVFTEVITPYLPVMRQSNSDPAQVIGDLLQTAFILNTGDANKKAQTLALIADQYGIDMDAAYQFRGQGQLVPQLQQQQPQQVDINAQIEAAIVQREVAREVEQFRADPKNVHFETVQPHMHALLSAGLAGSLQEAYDQAIYARPDLRSTLIAEQATAREAQQAAERAQRAAQARSAAVSPSGASGSPRPINSMETSLRDELQAGLTAMRGRA